MKLEHLHIHFEARGVELHSYDPGTNYQHCIYYDPDTNKRVSIPKMDGDNQEVKPELIIKVCNYFGIDAPKQVAARF